MENKIFSEKLILLNLENKTDNSKNHYINKIYEIQKITNELLKFINIK